MLVFSRLIDESPLQSKLTVLCCWPCAECQLWRELADAGRWPGLSCCAATDEELARMLPAANFADSWSVAAAAVMADPVAAAVHGPWLPHAQAHLAALGNPQSADDDRPERRRRAVVGTVVRPDAPFADTID